VRQQRGKAGARACAEAASAELVKGIDYKLPRLLTQVFNLALAIFVACSKRRPPFLAASIYTELPALEIKLAQCADHLIGNAGVIAPALQLLQRLLLLVRQSLADDICGHAVKSGVLFKQPREQTLRVGAQGWTAFANAIEPLAEIASVVQRNGVGVECGAGAADTIVQPLLPRFVGVCRRKKVQFHAG